MPRSKSRGDDSDEISPRYKHARRLAEEARDLEPIKPIDEKIETIYDSRGRPKKRKVVTMSNGNKFRRLV